jgi:polyphosphate kinase
MDGATGERSADHVSAPVGVSADPARPAASSTPPGDATSRTDTNVPADPSAPGGRALPASSGPGVPAATASVSPQRAAASSAAKPAAARSGAARSKPESASGTSVTAATPATGATPVAPVTPVTAGRPATRGRRPAGTQQERRRRAPSTERQTPAGRRDATPTTTRPTDAERSEPRSARTDVPPIVRPDQRYLDREASWLQFNQRVLELGEDRDTPLLERARYLAIFASNLDEFFMVRVAGLKRRMAAGLATTAASGLQPREVLSLIWATSRELMARHAIAFQGMVRPELAAAGIHIMRWADLTDAERERLYEMFREQIFPVLTPLAVDPAHPFPYISGLSLNLAVVVRNPTTGQEHFARVKVPPLLPRFVEAAPHRYVPLEDVIAAHLSYLFTGMEILGSHAFRVTRNEDLEVDADDAENLLQALERELMRRRFGPPVRLEVEESIDPHVLDLLVRELDVSQEEVFALPAPLDLTGLFRIADLDLPELKYRAFVPDTSPALADHESHGRVDLFAAVRARNVLLHHPYDSFATSVQEFLEQAAVDPNVLAIKQTLYRTSGDSPIVDALIDAAEAGKQVLVLVEIKARFDEHANITWARKLEQAGCHVVYGLVGLKTHCKLSLVVRQEGSRLRRYAHLGTGNYNPKTARQYEDIGLLTADPQVGGDLTRLFNRLSGYAQAAEYNRLLVAPDGLREGLIERIDAERRNRLEGRPARIRIKLNSIVDEAIIDALYEAADAGVPVELWVRGICALRPDVAGDIKVRSILGRFLEHSRFFIFANGEQSGAAGEVWMGSADLMHRNLDRRVETLVRLTDEGHRAELSALFDLAMSERTSAWELAPDGASWTRRTVDASGERLLDLQEALITRRNERRVRRT